MLEQNNKNQRQGTIYWNDIVHKKCDKETNTEKGSPLYIEAGPEQKDEDLCGVENTEDLAEDTSAERSSRKYSIAQIQEGNTGRNF